jgi:hypothetical protein
MTWFIVGLAYLLEHVLARATIGAHPIVGQILKGYIVVLCGIINITAYHAFPLVHFLISLIVPYFLQSAEGGLWCKPPPLGAESLDGLQSALADVAGEKPTGLGR